MIDYAPLVRDGLCTCRQDTSSSYAMYNDPYQKHFNNPNNLI